MLYTYEDVKDLTLEEIEANMKNVLQAMQKLSKEEQEELLEALRKFDVEEEY